MTTAPSPPFGVPRWTTVRTAGAASVVRFPAASSSTTPIDRVPSGSVAVSSDTVVPTSSGHGCGHLNEFGSAGSTCTHRPDESGTTAAPTSFPSAVTTTR